MNRGVAAVLVVLSVVLAGCGGMTGGPTTTAPTTDDVTETTTTETTTTTSPTTTTRDGGNGSSVDHPPGFGPDGPDERMLQRHFTESADMAFTADFRTFRGGGAVIGSLAVAGSTDEATAEFTQEGQATLNFYYTNGSYVRRVNDPSNITYRAGETSLENLRVTLSAPTLQFYNDVNWTYVETVERDGTTLYRYRATEVDQSQQGAPAPGAVEGLFGVILVDDEGVIYEYELTGNTSEGEFRYLYSLSDVGSTTVERPAWVDDALAQSENEGA